MTPRASRNEVTDILKDGTIKIRLTAPPVDGEANTELIKYLAKLLGVAPSMIEIIAGHRGRNKLISVINFEKNIIQQRMQSQVNKKKK